MPTGTPTRRLFFALWPDKAVRAELARATLTAVRGSGGRPVPQDNLHVTLAFLGSVAKDRVREIGEAAGTLKLERFELIFDRIEYWPKSAVLCATPSAQPELARKWVQDLWNALGRLDMAPDCRPWQAHVTLARLPLDPSVAGAIPPVHWQVSELALVESELAVEGSRYTVLQRWS